MGVLKQQLGPHARTDHNVRYNANALHCQSDGLYNIRITGIRAGASAHTCNRLRGSGILATEHGRLSTDY
eukprot:2250593-Prymnesium_polylepis.1